MMRESPNILLLRKFNGGYLPVNGGRPSIGMAGKLIPHSSFLTPELKMTRLSVNINKVALIRNARGGNLPDLAYVDQSRDALDDQATVWQEISDGQDILQIGRYEVQSRSYASRFNFRGSDQQKFVKDLSGGERNRLHLAKLLRRGANVLLLDEPTNDLDVETLRALEEGLLNFPGSAIVVSHDRWFLDRLCTHILAFEGNSQVVFHEGNYSDYEADRRKRLGDQAQPTRMKYKKLA